MTFRKQWNSRPTAIESNWNRSCDHRSSTGSRRCALLTDDVIAALVVVVGACAVVGAERVAADGAGRTAMAAAPPRALVHVQAAPPRPRRRTTDGVAGRCDRRDGCVVRRPKAASTSAEISAENVDAFRADRVARRHAFGTLVHICAYMGRLYDVITSAQEVTFSLAFVNLFVC